jgi:asparagine synthase (glutamine-hydrolysing)
MCGISGIINNTLQSYTCANLKQMTDAIAHRGPNDVGYVIFDNHNSGVIYGDDTTPKAVYESAIQYTPSNPVSINANGTFKLAFGHRRLSIIDLSPYGHLPMSYKKDRYWITFNGEIYNYVSLRQELIALGHVFTSQSDTEVIIAAYAQWGVDCQLRFKGMWAFVIFDTETNTIFISRDRFGIKPLYYWFSPQNAFCFASEIKQFTFLPGWKASLNGQQAFDYLMYNMTDHTDCTMFKGVFHIPPGHCFEGNISALTPNNVGKIDHLKWYQPTNNAYKGSFKEACESFKSHFKQSIKEHLIADVPVGSALSGGLDSSAIVCEISNVLTENGKSDAQKTFSYISSDERYNEKKWIDEVIKKTAVDDYYVTLSGEEVFKKTEDLIWFNDEPSQSQSLLASFLVYSKAKDENIKVLINGQGADEYLSGYGAFNIFRKVQLLKKLQFTKLRKDILEDNKLSKKSSLSSYAQLLYHLVPKFITRILSKRTNNYKQLLASISVQKLQAKQLHPYDSIPFNNDSTFNISQKQLLFDPLQKYLRYEDRMSMANSIEARIPFLDHHLVEFATQLPVEYLDGPGKQKKLMLYSLNSILPEAIIKRNDKIGFITSEENWVKNKYTQEFRLMLKNSIAESKGILNDNVLVYFDKVVENKIPFTYNYWRFIQFGYWMKTFNVENS